MKRLFFLLLLTGCQSNVSGDFGLNGSSNTPGGSDSLPQTVLRLGDRHYVTSALSQIFQPNPGEGATTGEITTIQNLITANVKTQYADFGGSCDYFLDRTDYCGSPLSLTYPIVETTNTMAPALTQATSLRAAFELRTIYTLLANDVALRKAISLASSTYPNYGAVNLTTIPAPTLVDLQNAYSIVYPGVSPSESTLSKIYSLTTAVEGSYGGKEAWKMAYAVLLSTLLWQQL